MRTVVIIRDRLTGKSIHEWSTELDVLVEILTQKDEK